MVSLEFWPTKYTEEVSTLSRLLHKKQKQKTSCTSSLCLYRMEILTGYVEDGAVEKGTLTACVLSCVQLFVT